MKNLFWKDGRLPWPLVFGVAYIAIALMVCDYVWRWVKMPFETLALFLILGNVIAIIVIYSIYKAVVRKQRAGA